MTSSADPPRPAGPETDEVLGANEAFAATFDRGHLEGTPARHLAVLTCMDARIVVEDVLGLAPGDANVIRNAGGLATDDALRSLVVSLHRMGATEVLVIEHTRCGMLNLDEDRLRAALLEATGKHVDQQMHGFADLESNLRAQVERIRAHPWLGDAPVSGAIYEVETGRLRRID